MTQQELQHLYWRAGFGINPNRQTSMPKNRAQVVEDLFVDSQAYTPIDIDLSYLHGIKPIDLKTFPELAEEIRKKGVKKILELNGAWVKRLMNPNELLRERMTLLWANHFVCRERNPLYVQQYNNTLRYFALGDFKAFVKAISKEAAMLRYLNGKQNRKNRPNENFARELMELFTLGEGEYSEKDIKESARAFTGYSHDFEGNFIFRKLQHDYESKLFFNRIGKHDGDDIIDIILAEKQCAQFISDKIYRYFVNPKPNKKHIDAMTEVFFKDYNIENLMRFVFLSDWFYDEENIGTKIKSPIDYVVGMAKTVPVTFEKEKDLLKIQKLLGQTLLDPPNVAGWKGDKAWIDANTIMIRLKLPSVVLNSGFIAFDEKDEFRKQFFKNTKRKRPFKTVPKWDVFEEHFKLTKTEQLQDHIIQGKINKGTLDYLKILNKSSKQAYCIQLMSIPEYQMC
ncbi:DUF1800 domain-containing protein [Winogradskyella sp. F6397]|uniref:DUF1800 domain-containing protein n=1 Tax=Winogradskyella marina TaxID=2785530 RepID=A0ABS0ELC5_9FLAO|nr:DUF1800 domain-containing protein [Winogradskyella marina]MBF8151267.1 DUF1800 domain-containing protein [Winogradskyella marina]